MVITVNKSSPLQIYLSGIGERPLLTREEEATLAKRIEAGDEGARKELTRTKSY